MTAPINTRDMAVNTDFTEESNLKSMFTCWGIADEDPVDLIPAEELRDKSLEGLTNTCDKAVSVLRNTIKSLGTVLKKQKFQPDQFKDVFAVPIQNLEIGKTKLENLLIDIRAQYHDIYFKDDRYFCNTYWRVREVKDWGYRFIDYASAAVALGLIVVEAAKAQNPPDEKSSTVQHWGITGGFLVLSKLLSAATDYRNKKTIEKEQRKNALLHLKYRCDKAKEAAAIINVLQAFTRSVEEMDPVEIRRQFKNSIHAIKEENGGVVSESIARVIKKELGSLIEAKIFKEGGAVALAKYKYERAFLKKIFRAWCDIRFSLDDERDLLQEEPLQKESATDVAVFEGNTTTSAKLKEIFREWNQQRREADNAAGIASLGVHQQKHPSSDSAGNSRRVILESVVVDTGRENIHEDLGLSATLQFSCEKSAPGLPSKNFFSPTTATLSPPNLLASINNIA